MKNEKEELIKQIKTLIDQNTNKSTQINLKYIDLFEVDELIDIKEQLLRKKDLFSSESKNYLDDIFEKCS